MFGIFKKKKEEEVPVQELSTGPQFPNPSTEKERADRTPRPSLKKDPKSYPLGNSEVKSVWQRTALRESLNFDFEMLGVRDSHLDVSADFYKESINEIKTRFINALITEIEALRLERSRWVNNRTQISEISESRAQACTLNIEEIDREIVLFTEEIEKAKEGKGMIENPISQFRKGYLVRVEKIENYVR